MAKNKNTSPYYDDFNAEKKFQQILFRPGMAVQARELSQIQSILQEQVDRVGSHIFKDGSQVIPGEIGIDLNLDYVTLEQQFNSVDINVDNFQDQKIIGKSSGAVATVLSVAPIENPDPNTLFLQYETGDSQTPFTGDITSGSNLITSLNIDAEQKFQVGMIITGTGIPADTYITSINSTTEIQVSNNITTTATTSNITAITSATFIDGEEISTEDNSYSAIASASNASGKGSRVTINRGIYYVLGYFLLVETQTIILEKYSNTPSYKVGLSIVDDFITEADDVSLVDPARGSFNFNAPGAHRYKVELILSKNDLDADIGESFIELLRVEDGIVQNLVIRPQYSELEKTLARRTFDESGDYVVRTFPIQIKEHLDTGSNFGVYAGSNGGDEGKLAISLEPGKAYVRGYEIEKSATTLLEIDKARTTETENNSITPFTLGNCIPITNAEGLYDISSYEEINLLDVDKADGSYPGNVLGTAKVRAIEFVSGTPGSGTEQYNVCLFDVEMGSDSSGPFSFQDVRSIQNVGDTRNADIILNGDGNAVLENVSNNSLLLPLNDIAVSSLSDVSYTVKRHQTGAMSGNSITISAGTNEVFNSYSVTNFQVSISSVSGSGSGNGYQNGEIIDLSAAGNSVTLAGSPIGKQAIITIPDIADSAIDIISTITKSVTSEKTKTLTTRNQVLTHSTLIDLDKADIHRITSIVDSTTSENITDRYILDNGQRDNFYDIGRLKFRTEYPAPVGNIDIDYEYFEHGNGDYFSVDTYDGVIDYADIPTYTSLTTGDVVKLSDVVDFRPRVGDTGTGFSVTSEIVASGENFICDYDYYVPRLDRIFLDSFGNFRIITGVPGKNPALPNVPEGGITLYNITVPAYTYTTDEIAIERIKNKRYTMKDIGKMEQRVESLEYYSSLNLLEKNTTDLFIDDGTGFNRFKSGFLVDNFTSHFVGNVKLPEYRCSIDKENQILRPPFVSNSVGLDLDTGSSSNYQQTGDLITLPYTTESFISQPFASRTENINPYDVFNWIGNILLTPASDEWFDTQQAPDRIIESDDGLADSLAALNGQVIWNDWQTTWTGTQFVTGSTSRRIGRQRRDGRVRDILEVSRLIGQEQGQVRTGTQFSVENTVNTQSLGDRIIDTSVIPFMRENTIEFSCDALKPSTQVFPFFDNVNVSEFVTPTGGALGDALITDTHGAVSGTFAIPNNDTIRFRTGERQFKLVDSDIDDPNFTTTSANALYTAAGTLRTQEETILSTRSARVVTSTVQDERTTIGFDINTSTRVSGWYDPLAQTFLIEQEGGTFLSSIDIFFASKDTSGIPVTLQIRNVVNGYPGKLIPPFGQVTLNPDQVNVSTDAQTPTTFTFPSPIYLENGEEYCFVLLANSIEYLVWTGKIGEFDVNTSERISKQPYAGVMFKSQNASTWTPDQEQDIKFDIHRCVFDDAVEGNVQFKNRDILPVRLGIDPLFTTVSSNVISVRHENHGLLDGDTVELSGAVGTFNNIPDTEINSTHTITYVDFDNYTITVTSSADTTGAVGDATISALGNIRVDVVAPLFENIDYPQTSSLWDLRIVDASKILHTNFVPFGVKQNVEFSDERFILSSENEPANKSSVIRSRISTDNKYISPVIDSQRASLITVTNRINNDATDETLPDSGASLARYITKKISLENPGTAARVYISALRPPLSEIKVYIKHLPDSKDNAVFDDEPYVEFNSVDYPAGDETGFRDYVFEIDNLETFSTYAIKIVMISAETSDTPLIKDFRTIALQ